MKYFDDSCNYIRVNGDKYSIGMEIEFFCGRGFATKYNKLIKGRGRNNVFGFDGSGMATKEFRSPVFISNAAKISIEQMEIYVYEVQQYLIAEFKAKFMPWHNYDSFGIHFSVGGKFGEEFPNLLRRSKIIQPKLINRLETETDRCLFIEREYRYPGTIQEYRSYYYNENIYGNAIRNKGTGIREFRFFPSCDVETILPYIKFITLDTNEPTNSIKFIR